MRLRTLLVPLLAAGLIGAPAAAGAGDDRYAPVDRPGPALSVPSGLLRKALTCEGDLRGARLTPVLLVPGTNVTPQEFGWNYMHSFRVQRRPFCAVELPVQATGDVQVAGEYVVYAIRTMARAAHRRIDVLGHSQGGMVPRWALRFWPDTRRLVDDLVGLAPSNHGTVLSQVTCVPGCPDAHRQQAAGSAFLAALNSRAETFAGVDYTSVYTRYDEVVVPNGDATGSSALRTGRGARTNVATQDICPANTADHLSIGTYDPVAYALAMDALDNRGPADPRQVSRDVCTQPLHPGVEPATFAADYGATLTILAQAYTVAPATDREPPLKPYVFARRRP
jgi:triacylglycerol esterase/lipase EstA (alpha/beta hydrolase family)